jgi:hypothetical protein
LAAASPATPDGKIHAIGGRITTSTDRTGEHDIYEPKTNS